MFLNQENSFEGLSYADFLYFSRKLVELKNICRWSRYESSKEVVGSEGAVNKLKL
jgi:hypothetical protein